MVKIQTSAGIHQALALTEGCQNAVCSFKNCASCRPFQTGLMSTTIVPCCENNFDVLKSVFVQDLELFQVKNYLKN